MQTTAIGTVANSLPQNEVILLTLLISKGYIPYTDLQKISGITSRKKGMTSIGRGIVFTRPIVLPLVGLVAGELVKHCSQS